MSAGSQVLNLPTATSSPTGLEVLIGGDGESIVLGEMAKDVLVGGFG